MWPFKKKAQNKIKIQVCDHKFKDFKWYITSKYNSDTHMFRYEIIKPYVCIFCGERKDITLRSFSSYLPSYDKAEEIVKSIQKKYEDKLQAREIIEDEIHDIVLVDREYLEIYSKLHPIKQKI